MAAPAAAVVAQAVVEAALRQLAVFTAAVEAALAVLKEDLR